MKEVNPFVISQFTNPSGEIVYRAAGWLDGKRVRQNFATRSEAEAQRQLLQVQRLQGETGIRTAVTRLTDGQLQEAEAAFLRLKVAPKIIWIQRTALTVFGIDGLPQKGVAEFFETSRVPRMRFVRLQLPANASH